MRMVYLQLIRKTTTEITENTERVVKEILYSHLSVLCNLCGGFSVTSDIFASLRLSFFFALKI